MDELLIVFLLEAKEQLAELEAGLLRMEQGHRDPETVNGVFRAAHTIKGAAGVAEAVAIEKATHHLENLLDRVRNGSLPVSPELITLLLQGCDHIGCLIALLESKKKLSDPALEQSGARLEEQLKAFAGAGAPLPPATGSGLADAPPAPVERESEGTAIADCWHLSLRFGRDILKNGMEPLAFLRYLSNLGEIVHIATLADAMPPAAEMDPEACYLGFEVSFRSHAGKEEIERVFEFVRDDCRLHILPPRSKVADFIALIDSLPEENLRLGEILVQSGALTREELDSGLRLQQAAAESAPEGRAAQVPPIGEILVAQNQIQPEIVEAAAARQKKVGEKKALDARSIRVHADKLDNLIDLVGELVIAGAAANLLARKSGQAPLVEATSVLARLVENIRDEALQLRMVQIGETFSRFHRVIRDVSRDLAKDIELVIRGAETELDKSVVEKIGDPLMHLVRNAIDHGIEPPEMRRSRGKSATGRVELNAFHDSGSIVIEVSDDGGGLDKDRIRAKAVERGIVAATQALSDQETINLIFEPGFSTADQVTNISGRGVGMDVVRKNITALRGSVDVSSEEGQGCRFTIRLPLTLAIIDGFLTAVGKSSYVIPLGNVVECIELQNDTGHRDYLNLRGEVLPFVRLRQMFEIGDRPPARENIVVVQYAGRKAGIVVDQLLGEFQAVIKPLGNIFRHIRGLGGSTILGSGEVALIVDVQALVQRCATGEALPGPGAPLIPSMTDEARP